MSGSGSTASHASPFPAPQSMRRLPPRSPGTRVRLLPSRTLSHDRLRNVLGDQVFGARIARRAAQPGRGVVDRPLREPGAAGLPLRAATPPLLWPGRVLALRAALARLG